MKSTEGGMTAVCEVMRKYEEIAKAQGKAEGKAEGIAEGIAEGMAKEKVSLARKLISTSGFNDEQISDYTGLSVEEIAAIRNGSAA